MITLHLEKLQRLSKKERDKLTLFLAASPEWKVTKLPEYRKQVEGVQISKREQRDGVLQLPENVIHHGETNPPQTFLDITLAANERETINLPRRGPNHPLTAESVTLSVQDPSYGDSRFRSTLMLTGEGIVVTVEELSHDLSRTGTKSALESLERAIAAALGETPAAQLSDVSSELHSSSCAVHEQAWGSRFSVRGKQSLKEPGFLFVEATGRVSGSKVQEITSDRELVGGSEESTGIDRVYYYDFEAMLHQFRSSDHLLKLMFEPWRGGVIRELASCTVEKRR